MVIVVGNYWPVAGSRAEKKNLIMPLLFYVNGVLEKYFVLLFPRVAVLLLSVELNFKSRRVMLRGFVSLWLVAEDYGCYSGYSL